MIDERIEKYMKHGTIEAKVDEKSLQEAKRKISDMFKSVFH